MCSSIMLYQSQLVSASLDNVLFQSNFLAFLQKELFYSVRVFFFFSFAGENRRISGSRAWMEDVSTADQTEKHVIFTEYLRLSNMRCGALT